jgi:hypothetical protein
VGLTELVQSIYRASNPVQRQNHERFMGDLLADMEVVPEANLGVAFSPDSQFAKICRQALTVEAYRSVPRGVFSL